MLKKTIYVTVLCLTFFAISSRTANAQDQRLHSSPAAFQTFFFKFKAAVQKSDKTAVAAMTAFPFKYGFDAGDEGKMSKTQFIKRFKDVFGKSPKDFLKENDPVFSMGNDGTYQISTEDAAHLSFRKSGDSFKFSAYLVEP